MTLEEQIAQITNPQEFTRLCNAILSERYGHDFQIIDGTRADSGNDGYITSEKRMVAMHCAIKPERRTDADYLKKIRDDINKAKSLRDKKEYQIENWTFLTPRKMSNDVISKMRIHASSVGIVASHQESTFLSSELLRNKHLLKNFPDLQIDALEERLDEILNLLKGAPLHQQKREEEIGPDGRHNDYVKNNDESNRVLEIRNAPETEQTRAALRSIYYKSTAPDVQLNALFGLLEVQDPIDDPAEEMVELCNQGIALAKRLDASSAKAFLLAHKGYFSSYTFTELYIKATSEKLAENAVGISFTTSEEKHNTNARLLKIEKQYGNDFAEALSIVQENHDYSTMAGVLILIGNAAGLRAMTLKGLDSQTRANAELAACRRALLTAKDLNHALGDEAETANAIFNLANQIRFFGETDEAMELAKSARETASRLNLHRLLKRADWLIETLKTGEIPDYLAGERRV